MSTVRSVVSGQVRTLLLRAGYANKMGQSCVKSGFAMAAGWGDRMPTSASRSAATSRDEAAAIENALRRQRMAFIGFCVLESVSALFSFLLLSQSVHSTPADYVLQSIITSGLLMFLAWLLLDVGKSVRKAAAIACVTVGLAYLLRVVLALHYFHRSELSLSTYFPPIMCYWPLMSAFFFTVLNRGTAIRIAGALAALTAVLTLLYVGIHPDALTRSNRGLEILQTLVFVNPLLVVLLAISSDVHARLGQQSLEAAHNRYQHPAAGAADTDPITGLQRTRGFIDQLRSLTKQCRRDGTELTVGYLERNTSSTDPQDDRIFVAEVHAALEAGFYMGRLSPNRFALAWPNKGISDVMDPVLDFVLLKNQELAEGKQVAIGLASWRTGETVYAILERCDDAVSKAMLPNSTGVSFNISDLDAG